MAVKAFLNLEGSFLQFMSFSSPLCSQWKEWLKLSTATSLAPYSLLSYRWPLSGPTMWFSHCHTRPPNCQGHEALVFIWSNLILFQSKMLLNIPLFKCFFHLSPEHFSIRISFSLIIPSQKISRPLFLGILLNTGTSKLFLYIWLFS